MAHKIANNIPDNKNQHFIVEKTSDGNLEVLILSEYLKNIINFKILPTSTYYYISNYDSKTLLEIQD